MHRLPEGKAVKSWDITTYTFLESFAFKFLDGIAIKLEFKIFEMMVIVISENQIYRTNNVDSIKTNQEYIDDCCKTKRIGGFDRFINKHNYRNWTHGKQCSKAIQCLHLPKFQYCQFPKEHHSIYQLVQWTQVWTLSRGISQSPKPSTSDKLSKAISFGNVQNLFDCMCPKRMASQLSKADTFRCLVFCTLCIQRNLKLLALDIVCTLY